MVGITQGQLDKLADGIGSAIAKERLRTQGELDTRDALIAGLASRIAALEGRKAAKPRHRVPAIGVPTP